MPDPVLAAQQEYAITTGHLALPLSPPIPSSLPEVTPASAEDPLLHLKQQLSIPLPTKSSNLDTRAKSNHLLSLLRQGSATEMRNDPHTPLDQATILTQPRSPKRPAPEPRLHDMMNMQSPPPSLDIHPQTQPTAPPSSALPQLNQHTRSLLDAFSKPNIPQSPATEATGQLPASKQNLLAAFTAQPKTSPQPTPSPADNAASGLLQMLQRKKGAASATQELGLHDPAVQQQHPPTSTAALPPLPIQQHDVPAAPSPFNPVAHVQHQIAPSPAPVAQQPRSWASVATSAKQPPQPTKIEAVTKPQPEPAELSAASEHDTKSRPADKAKINLLALHGSMPSKAPKTAEPKSRHGTTAATLDRPIDEPDFDMVARASTFEDELKREPITSDRKLFDPKHGEPKQSPAAIRVMSRHDDRSRAPKSPRTTRQKQSNTSRPVTPKEIQKPFQPQILRRPQTADGEAAFGLPSLLPPSSAAPKQVATPPTVSPLTAPTNGPSSPSTDAPQAMTTTRATNFPSSAMSMPVAQDPSRAALLDLLRTPTQQATKPEADATPKQSSASFTATQQPPLNGIISPTTASQLVSPVLDDHHDTLAPRSRVSSLASTAPNNVGARPQIEKRQTAAGDKAFLMSYLKNFAGQGQEAA